MYVNKWYPNYLLSVRTVGDATDRLTRQRNHVCKQKTNTVSGARSLLVRDTKLWNNLPSNVKEANTLQSESGTLTSKRTMRCHQLSRRKHKHHIIHKICFKYAYYTGFIQSDSGTCDAIVMPSVINIVMNVW